MELVDVGFPPEIVGKGLGGGISAVEPVFALGPIPTLATRDGIKKRSATLLLLRAPVAFVVVLPVEDALPSPTALGGLLATGALEVKFEPDMESRCLCRSRVGTKSVCTSASRSEDKKPEDNRASRSSIWKK